MIVALHVLRRALALALGLAVALLAADSARAQQMKITGTTVSLAPPAGFSIAAEFAGLVNKETSSSILIVEFPPVAHDELAALFSSLESVKMNFAPKQVLIDTLETLDLPAGKVPFATGTQKIGAVTFDKWITLIKGPKIVLLTVQAPQHAKFETATVKTLLNSVVLGAAASIAEKLAVLPFTVAAAEPFRVIDTFGGLGVLMTVGPLDTDPTWSQPSVIVAYQQLPGLDASNIEVISDTLLRGTHGYAEASIAAKERIAFAGVRGLRTRGTRKTSAGAEKQFIHDLAISHQGRHIRLLASGDEQQMRKLQAAVDAIAKSIAFKQ